MSVRSFNPNGSNPNGHFNHNRSPGKATPSQHSNYNNNNENEFLEDYKEKRKLLVRWS
jgi:hypothetical protein